MKRKRHIWINDAPFFSAMALVPFTIIQATPVKERRTFLIFTDNCYIFLNITLPQVSGNSISNSGLSLKKEIAARFIAQSDSGEL